jgi:hypothetical protein
MNMTTPEKIENPPKPTPPPAPAAPSDNGEEKPEMIQ